MIEELDPSECVNRLSEFVIIDVRSEEEYLHDMGHIAGSTCSMLQTDFQQKVKELDKTKKYLFVCRSGRRSFLAAEIAKSHGIEDVTNMSGGMILWTESGLPVVK